MQPKGFSLIEVVLTFFLLTLMVISIFSIFPQARRGLDHSDRRVKAAYIAERFLENENSQEYGSIGNSRGTYTLNRVNNGVASSQSYDYIVRTSVIDASRKRLWVTISWQEPHGTDHITVETLVLKP